jgi:hypothetical protein
MVVGAIALCLAGWTATASADTISGPTYPPPGGVTFSGAGSLRSGTATWSYSNFDNTAYGNLWWGPSNSTAIGISFDGPGYSSNELLSAPTLSGNTATYYGTSTMNTSTGPKNVDTRFTLVALDSSNNPINWATGSSQGIATSAVISVPGDYKILLTAEAKLSTSSIYQSVQSLYDNSQTFGSNLNTSFGGGFFATAAVAPVPLPSAAWAGLALMGGLGVQRFRRSRAQRTLS